MKYDVTPMFGERISRILPLLIVVFIVVSYSGVFRAVFLFDDNTAIISGCETWRMWRDSGVVSARVVADATFALNHAISGTKAADYHAVSLLIHAIIALLLFGLIRRTLNLPIYAGRFDGTSNWLAFAATALWAIHPLTTAAVAPVAQRYELLMAMFYAGTLYCVARGSTSARGKLWDGGAVLACILGMGCKEVMITAPAAVLLYEWIFLPAGSVWRMLRKRWLLHVGLVGAWLALLTLMGVGHAANPVVTGYGWKGISPIQYAMAQPDAILRYLKLSLWPSDLCFDYQWRPGASVQGMLLAGIIPGLLLIAGVIGAIRRSALGFLVAMFFLVLVPSSSFLPRPDIIVEYRVYLPLCALVVLVVIVAYVLLLEKSGDTRVKRAVAGALLLAVLCVLSLLTMRRIGIYGSAEDVWRDVISKCPKNGRAYINLSGALLDRGKFDEAAMAGSNLLARLPDFSGTEAASIPAAITDAETAKVYVEARYYAHAHNCIGVADARKGLTAEAIAHFREALRLMPQFDAARMNLVQATAELQAGKRAVAP